MFEFTRGGTKYFIRYGDGVSENLLICSFYDVDQQRYRWVSSMDSDDLDSPILKYKGDVNMWLKEFYAKINKVLDEFFGEPEKPAPTATTKEKITHAVSSKTRFNEKTQHIELI